MGGRRLPRADRQPAAGPQPDQRFPSPAPGCPGWAVRSGAAVVPEGRAGEPGPGGAGWHQGQSQCQQTRGHEPRADAQVRAAARRRDARSAAQGRDHRRPGGRPVRQGRPGR